MTNLHTDGTETTRTTRRSRLARVFAIGALAVAAAVSFAAPAQAAVAAAGHVATADQAATATGVSGRTINYNEGTGGSCVYYALDRFHKATGVYPMAFGDARYLAGSAAANGWAVSTRPRVNSLVVFQPGQNGAAAPTGHAAWVERISGAQIYISEMNAPRRWTVSYRWVTPARGVQYIYTR